MTNPGNEGKGLSGPRDRSGFEPNLFTPSAKLNQRSSSAVRGRCPNCGVVNRSHASVCPECGENLQAKPRKVRCRHCGKGASSVLVICPHCGRELEDSSGRLLVVVGSVVLALLFFVVLATRWNQLHPLGWLQAQMEAGLSLINNLGASMDPTIIVETTPVSPPTAEELEADDGEVSDGAGGGEPDAATPEAMDVGAPPPSQVIAQIEPASLTVAPAVSQTDASLVPASPTPIDTPTSPPTPSPTETATPAPTETATPAPTDTVAPTETMTEAPSPTSTVAAATVLTVTATITTSRLALVVLPTATPTSRLLLASVGEVRQSAETRAPGTVATADLPAPTETFTPSPTSTVAGTPTSAPSPTPAPQATYQIRAGDTLSGIAARFDVGIDDLMAANNLTAQDVYLLRPGENLIIPGEAATVNTAVASAPVPTTPPRTYRVQAGDTPIAIANAWGISVDALLLANGLSLADARRLRSGQELIIPSNGQAGSTIVNTNNSGGGPAIRVDPPRLRSPENGAQLSCSTGNALAWESVPFIQNDDQFIVHLGFVSGVAADGQETIVWVLEQVQTAQNTLWMMDSGLCALAPQELGRKWYWYVEVVNANRTNVSEASAIWSFFWN